jgi:stage V sporulation protein B
MTSVYRSFFEGMQNMIPTSVSQVVESVLKMISGLFFSKLFYENHTLICSFLNISDSENIAAAFGAMLGITFSCISSCFYMFIASFRTTLKIQSKIDISCPSFADISKKLMCFFLPAALVALLSNISTITDLVTIKPLLKNSIANQSIYADIKTSEISVFIFGAYNGLAITVFNLVPSVTNMIGKSVLACTTQAVNSGNKAYISKCISSAVFSTSFIAMPLSLGILSLTKEILSILFKNAPSEVSVAVMPLKYLSFGIIFLSFTFPMFGIFQAVNKQNIPVFLMIIGGIIKFILNIVLIPIDSINISGAAIATTLSYFVIFVLSVIIIRKELDISYIFFKSVFEVLICSVLCAVCARGIFDISANYLRDEISLISGVVAGGIVYILSLWAMGYKSLREFR